MKYTGQQIQLTIVILEAFIEDKNSVVQKASTLPDFALCDKPPLQIKERYLSDTLREVRNLHLPRKIK